MNLNNNNNNFDDDDFDESQQQLQGQGNIIIPLTMNREDHSYHDHSQEIDPTTLTLSGGIPPHISGNRSAAAAGGGRRGGEATTTAATGMNESYMNHNDSNTSQQSSFPIRLHYILSGELERDNMNHIASWQPHGRCFLVHDRAEFVKHVLPR